MSHSSYVYLRGDEIVLPPFLTRPLNLDLKSLVVGLYYSTPTRIRRDDYAESKFCHDIIFTPIPYTVWPYALYITVRLREGKGRVAYLTEWLEKKNVNIINTNSCRSGNRHFLFRAYGFFEDVHNEFIREIYALDGRIKNISRLRKRVSDVVSQQALNLKKELIKDAKTSKAFPQSYLYKPETYCVIEPIDATSSYFWDMREEHSTKFSKQDGWKCLDPYVFNNRLSKRNGVTIPSQIINKISSDGTSTDPASKSKPWFWGMAHVDEVNAQVRVTLISESEFNHFKRFEIEYSSSQMGAEEPLSTKGLMHTCSSVISECGYNLFSINSSNWNSSDNTTEGSIYCLVESTSSSLHCEVEDLQKRLNMAIDDKWGKQLNVEIRARSITPYRIFVSISNHSRYRKRILKELIQDVGPRLGLIEPDQSFIVITSTGKLTPKEVQTGIQNCDGVIQFCEPLAKDQEPSVWLEVETFSARTLGKPVLYVYVSTDPDEPGKRERALNALPRTEIRSEPEYYDVDKGENERIDQLQKALQSLIDQIDEVRGYVY